LIAAGIKAVYYRQDYRTKDGLQALADAGVVLAKV
jgi:deoxycytidylate deaminase